MTILCKEGLSLGHSSESTTERHYPAPSERQARLNKKTYHNALQGDNYALPA